jgi:peptidoglycan/LPS O-acetylase OafA/YrhL
VVGTPAATTRSTHRIGYVAALDGLRGIAVLAVLLYHAEFGWARGGFLGVSVFFTLSGFLITTLLVTEHGESGRIDLRAFWQRRARRLLPAALITLVIIGVVSWWLDEGRASLRGDSIAALANVANWRFVWSGASYSDLFAEPSPVQHYWSLSIEEQFYVVFPLVVAGSLVVARGRRTVLAGSLAVLATSSVLLMLLSDATTDADRLYYGTDARAFEFLAGAGLALWMSRRGAPPRLGIGAPAGTLVGFLGVAALGVVVALFATVDLHTTWLYEGGLPVFALLSGVIIWAALEPKSWLARILAIEPLRRLGIVSYGVYLLHWPVFLWLDGSRTGLSGWSLFALRLAVTLTLATLLYRLVETPVRAGRLPVVGHRLRWWVAPAGMATVVAVVVATTVAAPPSPVFNPATSPDQAISDLRARPASSQRLPRVLVVGDSVAGSLGAGLVDWAHATGRFEVVNYGVARCAVVEGGQAALADGPGVTECGDWVETREEIVRVFDPDVVVMLTGPWDIVDRRLPQWDDFHGLGDPNFDSWLLTSYRAVVAELSAGGAPVVWLTAPCAAEIPGPLFETGAFDNEQLTYLNDRIIPDLAAAESSVQVVDLYRRICPDGRARDDVEGVPDGRPDGVHFSVAGAYALSEWLGPQLVRRVA